MRETDLKKFQIVFGSSDSFLQQVSLWLLLSLLLVSRLHINCRNSHSTEHIFPSAFVHGRNLIDEFIGRKSVRVLVVKNRSQLIVV